MKNNKNSKVEVIEAAGGLLWRGTSTQPEIVIIHRSRYNDWTLPKGKREAGESWGETALREVREETGYIAHLENFAGGMFYSVDNIPKVVLFWHMRILEDQGFKPNEEVEKLVWLSPEEAKQKMSYPAEIALIPSEFSDFLK
jgi:8-oxo-dGTP pyrophosphatase MutT (NUDIX family)